MEGQERREKILELLQTQKEPVAGSQLAKQFGVSRQIIVQDIALLRASNRDILSTARGYLLFHSTSKTATRCFSVYHNTAEIETELCAIVDHGGRVLDVIVTHPIYGTISADLLINTHKEAQDFAASVERGKTVPLKELTNSHHFHTVEADSEAQLDEIENVLRQLGFLNEDSSAN